MRMERQVVRVREWFERLERFENYRMAAITGAIQRGAGYTIGEKKEPPKQPMSNNRRKMKGIQMIRRQQLRRVQRKRRKKDERLAAAIITLTVKELKAQHKRNKKGGHRNE